MISEKLKNIIISVLNIDDVDLNEQTTADQVPGWDSLSHLNVITAIEKEYSIRFKTLELLKMKDVGELQAMINKKLETKV